MAGQGSARVTLKEIDLSQVRDPEQLPQGVPAAVVGPAKRGPAFVPKTFANMQQFGEVFGSMSEVSKESNANRFGPLALNEWMRNAQAGTFLRTLGIGSSEGRENPDGTVDGAGFVVGNKVSYDSAGKLKENTDAIIDPNHSAGALKASRTHFLGCFMKDTANSTLLQDAGLQTESASASFVIDFGANKPSNGDSITIEAIDSSGTAKFFKFVFNTGDDAISANGGIGTAVAPQIITLGINTFAPAAQLDRGLRNLDGAGADLAANPSPADYFATPVVNANAVTVSHAGSGESTNSTVSFEINAAPNAITITSGTTSKENSVASQSVAMTLSGATNESTIIQFDSRPGTEATNATATISLDDGGANLDSIAAGAVVAGQTINLINTDTTKNFTYVVVDTNNNAGGAGALATGDVIASANGGFLDDAVSSSVANDDAARDGFIAVVVDLSAVGASALMTELKVAIQNVNGHDGSITVGNVVTIGDESSIVLTQALAGINATNESGNTAITSSIAGIDNGSFQGGTPDQRAKFSVRNILGAEVKFRLEPDNDIQNNPSLDLDVDYDIGIRTPYLDFPISRAQASVAKDEIRNRVLAAIQDRITLGDFNDASAAPVISVAAVDAAVMDHSLKVESLLVGEFPVANPLVSKVDIPNRTINGFSLFNTPGDNGTNSAVTLTFDDVPQVGDSFTLTTIDPATNASSDVKFEFIADNAGATNGAWNAGATNGAWNAGTRTVSVERHADLTVVLTRIQDALEAQDAAKGNIDTKYSSEKDPANGSITITRNDDIATNNLGFVFDQNVTFSLRETATVQGLRGLFGSQTFTMQGGGGGAVPVIRGILMSPRGVVPSLEQNSADYNQLSSGAFTPATAVNAANVLKFGTAGGDMTGYEIGKVESQSFKVLLNGYIGNDANVLDCSFDPESVNYFAKVLNTDPDQIESRGHYLYAHWDIDAAVATPSSQGVKTRALTAATDGEIAFCMHSSGEPRQLDGSKPDFESFDTRFKTACSPFIQTQGFGQGATKEFYDLFKLHALDDGEVANDRFRVLISNIIAPSVEGDYGSFDLSLESFYSDPIQGEALIAWKRLSLDPDSKNYIARVIGDKHMYYDFDRVTSKQRLVEEGDFDVKNNYVRVEVSELVKSKEVPTSSLPCGFKNYRTLNTEDAGLFVESGSSAADKELLAENIFDGLKVLPLPLVKTITRASGDAFEASEALAWGVKFAKKQYAESHKETSEIRFNDSIRSWTKFYPNMDDISFAKDSSESFSLERIAVDDPSNINWGTSEYVRSGLSSDLPLTDDPNDGADVKKQFITLSDAASVGRNIRYLKFRFIMQGGFDGLDIFNKEKAEMSSLAAHREANDENNNNTFTGATVQAFRRAVDVLADKSATELQLLAIPGIREPVVTDYAITACESRFDAMLVMDIEEVDRFNAIIVDPEVKPSVSQIINNFETRRLDTSFAAAYFPDVVMRRSSNGSPLQVPPSVGMLGVMSLNDTLADPWFAPAGLTRGRLNALNSKVQMNRDVLNDLYDADINPIYEPAGRSGEVYAFGQKTLMQNQSALDRINVRRLLINLRRKVKNVANTLLFEPNRASTLARFSSLVEPIMAEVQARQGVERYKIQIDTTTTTQNDVENNTIRGKIYLQPTKSVEFISLDFVVTNSID